MDYYNGPMMNRNDWGWGIFMMLFWLIVLVVIAYVVMRLIKNHESTTNTKIDPIDIAKERYAKGEISKEQYDELKKELR
jgi:putative membrane protein